MKNIATKPLYEFKVVVEENLSAQMPYRLTVTFSGDTDFYERLIAVAKNDNALFTRRTLPFFLKLLHQEKYLFYFEQRTNKKSKHVQWSLEDILRQEKDTLTFKDKEDVLIVRQALLSHLNLFAREEALKISKA
jgi:hypothetical protein